MQPAKRRGFTLIELLVVIAIIGILASMLFPVFAQAREKARSIVCITYEKELGMALSMYADSNDELLPVQDNLTVDPTSYWLDVGGGVPNWANTLQPNWALAIYGYVTNREMYVCKSNKGWTPNSNGQMPGNSYIYNGYGSGKPGFSALSSSETIILWDYRYLTSSAVADPVPTGWSFSTAWSTHNDMFNLLYLDWHAKARPAAWVADGMQALGNGQPNPFQF